MYVRGVRAYIYASYVTTNSCLALPGAAGTNAEPLYILIQYGYDVDRYDKGSYLHFTVEWRMAHAMQERCRPPQTTASTTYVIIGFRYACSDERRYVSSKVANFYLCIPEVHILCGDVDMCISFNVFICQIPIYLQSNIITSYTLW